MNVLPKQSTKIRRYKSNNINSPSNRHGTFIYLVIFKRKHLLRVNNGKVYDLLFHNDVLLMPLLNRMKCKMIMQIVISFVCGVNFLSKMLLL